MPTHKLFGMEGDDWAIGTYAMIALITVMVILMISLTAVGSWLQAKMGSKTSGFAAGSTPGLVLFEPNQFSVQHGVGTHAAFMGSASTAQPIGNDALTAYQNAVLDNRNFKDPCGKNQWYGESLAYRSDNGSTIAVGACYDKDSEVLNPSKSKYSSRPHPVPARSKSGFAPAFDPRDPRSACTDMWDLGALQDISEQVMMTNMGPHTGHESDELENELKQFN
jgi:hypothetical protein